MTRKGQREHGPLNWTIVPLFSKKKRHRNMKTLRMRVTKKGLWKTPFSRVANSLICNTHRNSDTCKYYNKILVIQNA